MKKNGDDNMKKKFPRIEMSEADDIIYTWVCQIF